MKLLCRLGCLPILTRVVREESLPPEQARCRLCDGGESEDLHHFLLVCPALQKHRDKMEAAVAKSLVDFQSLEPADQIDTLLGKSSGDVCADDKVNRLVTRFLKKAWRTRKWLTMYLNVKLGRSDTIWALKTHGDGEVPQADEGVAYGKGRNRKMARAG